MIIPKFKVGDIVVTHLWEYGLVEKVEEHILIKRNETVHVYYLRMFNDDTKSTIFFYEDTLVKVSK